MSINGESTSFSPSAPEIKMAHDRKSPKNEKFTSKITSQA
jgi:hypothetical protein